jgi:hypothetical protein
MTKKEKAKSELEDLVMWIYKGSFLTIFKYSPVDKSTKLSPKTEDKINSFIEKYVS